MKISPATKTQKAKMYLDGRDLDQSNANGTQVVKSVILTQANILILIDAQFDPENILGVPYSAGKVSTQISLNRANGKLKKVEMIQGGILGATFGDGTHVSEEVCLPSKSN